MQEMKEIRFGNNLAVLKDNIVKTSILPQKASELSRNLKLQGNVVVEGGVFAHSLEIENGPALFKGAVYAEHEIHISGAEAGKIIFEKSAASANSINAFLASGRAIFGADINAISIKLKNCFVGGSIFATEVFLENCIVLGGVFGTKKITLQNTIVGTFNSPEVNLAGVSYLLYPSAFSVEPLSPLPGAELYNLSLADLGALFKGDKEDVHSGKIKMDFTHDSQRTVLNDEKDDAGIGANIVVNSYSIASRVLAADLINLEKLENHFVIGAGSMGSQILKNYTLTKGDGTKSKELVPENIADFFFSIVEGKTEIQELNSQVSLNDFKKIME